MINYKILTLTELKTDYSERNGFVFMANIPSSDSSIEKLCNTLIDYKIVYVLPEFVTKLNINATAFVYPDGQAFDYWNFHAKARIVKFMGQADINTLSVFLRTN